VIAVVIIWNVDAIFIVLFIVCNAVLIIILIFIILCLHLHLHLLLLLIQ